MLPESSLSIRVGPPLETSMVVAPHLGPDHTPRVSPHRTEASTTGARTGQRRLASNRVMRPVAGTCGALFGAAFLA